MFDKFATNLPYIADQTIDPARLASSLQAAAPLQAVGEGDGLVSGKYARNSKHSEEVDMKGNMHTLNMIMFIFS